MARLRSGRGKLNRSGVRATRDAFGVCPGDRRWRSASACGCTHRHGDASERALDEEVSDGQRRVRDRVPDRTAALPEPRLHDRRLDEHGRLGQKLVDQPSTAPTRSTRMPGGSWTSRFRREPRSGRGVPGSTERAWIGSRPPRAEPSPSGRERDGPEVWGSAHPTDACRRHPRCANTCAMLLSKRATS